MRATQLLHDLGQSLWLDNITRDLLNDGTLKRYIAEFSVTGLTSNPTIFDHAIKNSSSYDHAIRESAAKGENGEELFFELALEDITRAADLFRPVYDRTNGVDGWVSLEVSPLLAHDTASTLVEAKQLFARADRPNLLIKIPGTKEGLPAIEEAIFAGIPINVTLLFSREQHLAAADAYMRGVERRIKAGLNPKVGSVASVFISRWDTAVAGKIPTQLTNHLGIAIALRTYKVLNREYTELATKGKVDAPGPIGRYAYGFGDKVFDGKHIIGHNGGWPGVAANFEMYPELGYTSVILMNADPPMMMPVIMQLRKLIPAD